MVTRYNGMCYSLERVCEEMTVDSAFPDNDDADENGRFAKKLKAAAADGSELAASANSASYCAGAAAAGRMTVGGKDCHAPSDTASAAASDVDPVAEDPGSAASGPEDEVAAVTEGILEKLAWPKTFREYYACVSCKTMQYLCGPQINCPSEALAVQCACMHTS